MKVDHCIQYHDVITNPVWWTTANMKIVVNQSINQSIKQTNKQTNNAMQCNAFI